MFEFIRYHYSKKVNYINNSTFENCTSLNSVVLQDGVTEISNNAFGNCYSIKYFEFTSSVKLFKSDAFINARNYSEDNTVNFIGTISDWLDIKFEMNILIHALECASFVITMN